MTDKNQLEADFGINNGFAPGPEGPRAFGYDVVFPGSNAEVLVDLTLASDLGFIDKAQGIFVDNTGTVAIVLRVPGVEQRVRIPPGSQYTGPVLLPRELRQLYFTSNEAKTVRVIVFNVPLPLAVYSSSGVGTVTVTGTVTTQETPSTTATRTSVASANVDTLLLAANTARETATIYNESTATLYVALGSAAASLTSYTVQVAPGGYYELPYVYTGQIRGIWSAVNGNARITELT